MAGSGRTALNWLPALSNSTVSACRVLGWSWPEHPLFPLAQAYMSFWEDTQASNFVHSFLRGAAMVTSFALGCKQFGSIKHLSSYMLWSLAPFPSQISATILCISLWWFFLMLVQFILCKIKKSGEGRGLAFWGSFNLRKCTMTDSSFTLLAISKLLLHYLVKIVFLAAVH